MNDVTFFSATGLAAAIRTGQISCSEALAAHLDQIKKHNPSLNAIVTLDETGARMHAKDADAALARGQIWGPLHGVPVTIQDAIETQGLRTTAGYKPFRNHVPQRDAPAVTGLRVAGAVIVGKTNVSALAIGTQTDNALYGRTNNPWNQTYTPGGSSGGGAAAVAAGMSTIDLGSDMSGSLRMPAHFCGIYSLKPTGGRVSIQGHITGAKPLSLPEGWEPLLQLPCIGPMARSVADLRVCLQATADPTAPALEVQDAHRSRTLRVGWTDEMGGMPICQDTRRAVRELAAGLSVAGMEVERQPTAYFDYADAWELAGEILGAMNTLVQTPLDSFLRRTAASVFSDRLQLHPFNRGFMRGSALAPEGFAGLLQRRHDLTVRMDRFFDKWDAWICPAGARHAFTHRSLTAKLDIDDQKLSQQMAALLPTVIFNITGHPVVVIPVDQSRDGLPVGAQIVGKRWGEMALLEAAERISQVAGPCRRPPGY